MVSPERHMQAMEKIAALINVRERCIKETRERLLRASFTPEEAEDAIETALRVGIIDEERYARAFIRGKVHSRWGKNKIIMRLRQQDIPEDIINACSDEFPSSDQELKTALYELSKRPSTSKDLYASYMRRLTGKGFSYEVSSCAVKIYLSDDSQA